MRILDEKIFDEIAKELQQGIRKEGLWLKALSKCNGDEISGKAEYLKLRHQSLLDEIALSAENSQLRNAEVARDRRYYVEALNPRVKEAIEVLEKRGYQISDEGSGWVVTDSNGGRQMFNSINQLEGFIASSK